MPVEFHSYWEDFLQLTSKRHCSESGFSPITFVDIAAWCRVVNVEVSQLWLDVIDALDQVWLRVQSQK